MDIEKLRNEHKDLTTKARAIQQVADDEKRELTVEEARAFEDLMARTELLATRIAREEALQSHEAGAVRSYRQPTRPDVSPNGGGVILPGQPAKFRSLAEQLRAVGRASQPGGTIDNRLIPETRAATGMGETIGGDGGFLVQTDLIDGIIKRTYETGALASRCRRIQVSSNANSVKLLLADETSRATGSRLGGVQVYMAHEADAVTASKPKIRPVEVHLNKMMAACYLTDELLQDSAVVEGLVTQSFQEEIAFKLDDLILRGTGQGEPLGILNSAALVSVAKETGQQAATIDSENVIKMWSRAWVRGRLRANWFNNQDIEPQLFQFGIQVGVGGSTVYMPPGGLSQSPYGTIFGRPMVAIEHAESLGTQGDIGLFDLTEYLLIDKGAAQTAMSVHVRFLNDEMVFRFVYRVGGQPLWYSPLTPYKGSSNTVSPFVVLDTRS